MHVYIGFYLGNEEGQSKLCVCVCLCGGVYEWFLEKLCAAADP